MRRIHSVIGGALLALGMTTSSPASTIGFYFDPTGTGNFTNAGTASQPLLGSFDFVPGNALAVGAVPITTTPTTFNLYTQSTLGSFLETDGVTTHSIAELALLAGMTAAQAAALEMSFQGLVNETGAASGASSASFVSNSGQFTVYLDTSKDANSITGGGYGDGTTIISGDVRSGDTSTFALDTSKAPTLLDNFGADNQNGVLTVTGAGGGQVVLSDPVFNPNYFKLEGIDPTLLLQLFYNTSFITPFNQTNPSDQVFGQTPYYSLIGGSKINGLFANQGCANENGGTRNAPCDFHFQADANASITGTTPEPGTIALLGLALAGLGLSRRNGSRRT